MENGSKNIQNKNCNSDSMDINIIASLGNHKQSSKHKGIRVWILVTWKKFWTFSLFCLRSITASLSWYGTII